VYSKNTKCKGRGDNEAPACHVLHYTWDSCTRVMDGPGTGTAQCQTDIPAEEVADILHRIIDKHKSRILVAA
jgi:hypothetical protein